MRKKQAILLLSTAAGCAQATNDIPRGVGPEFVSFYKPSSGSFTCISNPSVHLSFAQVNDDFCDCPDGSDEPGTAACAYISSLSPHDPSSKFTAKHALPGFYCQNKGHKPSYLPFTNVNDGVCDYESCCDGSDEYGDVGNVNCKDKCDEIGKEWKKHDEARQKSYTTAVSKRHSLTVEAAKKRQEIEMEIENLKTQVQVGELNVAQLTKEKDEIEQREKSRVVKDGGLGVKISSLLDSVKPKVEELEQNLRRVKTMRDKYWSRISELETILEAFHTEYNPNFNDEGVKRAVRSYEGYKAIDKSNDRLDLYSTEEVELDSLVSGLEGINWEELEGGAAQEESDVEALYSLQAYLPLSLRNWISGKIGDLRVMLIANGILAAPSSSGLGVSKAVIQASERLRSATESLEEQRKKQKDHEEDLTKDYGADDVFRTLKDTCVSLDAGEYTYELCWLQQVRQISKKNSGSQDMGSFSGYDTITVDENLPADGKGLGSGVRLVQKYEDGSHCWNGPNRSTTVVLACSETEEVWKVTEEEKCVYRMEVGTPAVCDVPGKAEGSSVKISGAKVPSVVDHDEL